MEENKNNSLKREKTLRFCISNPILPIKKKPDKVRKVWFSQTRPGEKVIKDQEKNFLKSLSFAEVYNSTGVKLGLHLFHMLYKLCRKNNLPLRIPETIIYGYGFESPTFLYTDFNGYLRAKTKLNPLQLETIYQIFEYYRQKNKKLFPTPLAIQKSPNSAYDRVLMKGNELLNEIKGGFKTDTVIQRYILPKGNKSCKLRVVIKEGQEAEFYTITSKFRLDGKQEIKPKKPPEPRLPDPLPLEPTVSVEMSSLGSNIFNKVHEATEKSKPINKSEQEIIALGRKYMHDRILAGKVKELGSAELSSTLAHLDHKETFDTHISIKPEQKLTFHQARAAVEMNKYLREVQKSYIPIKDSLENLYRKFLSFDGTHCPEVSIKEEIAINNNITNKLRMMFCIDSKNLTKSLGFKIKSTSGYGQLENIMEIMKKSINSYYLFKENKQVSFMVCDFCEDMNSQFYLVKIRHLAGKIHQPPPVFSPTSMDISFDCPGDYCNYHDDMSRDIESTTKTAHQPKVYKVLKQTFLENQKTETLPSSKSFLHQTVEVCKNCFNFYMKKEREKVKSTLRPQLKKSIDVSKYHFYQPIKDINKELICSKGYSKEISKRSASAKSLLGKRKIEIINACKFTEF